MFFHMVDKDKRCWNVLSEIHDRKRYQDLLEDN